MTGSREAEDFWGRAEADDLPVYTASIAQGLTQNGVETSGKLSCWGCLLI